jgi:hypothetical protein
MSQITRAEISGITISKMIHTCSEVVGAIYRRLVKEMDIKGCNALKLKELENLLESRKYNSVAGGNTIRSQVDEVRAAMKKTDFIKMDDKEKINLEKILILKHTSIAAYSDAGEIQQVATDIKVNVLDTKWDKLVEKAEVKKINYETGHIFQSFIQVCGSLNFVENEKVIKPGKTSFIKLNDKVGRSIILVTEAGKGTTKITMDMGGFDPESKSCEKVANNILNGLKKKGIILSDVKRHIHNNPLGMIKINAKRKVSKIAGLVAGAVKKGPNRTKVNFRKINFLR